MVKEDLRRLNKMIQEAVETHFEGKFFHMQEAVPRKYGRAHFDLESFKGLESTDGKKPYQSRATIPVGFENGRDLEMVIIHFQPGGGTGNNGDYQNLIDLEGNLLLPQQTPRLKKGISGEIMLPLVDLNGFEGEQIGSTSLDYITLTPSTDDPMMLELLDTENMGKGIIRRNFGKHDGTFEGQFDPLVYDTLYDNGMYKKGNPHAIYNPKSYDQVVGFIAFPK